MKVGDSWKKENDGERGVGGLYTPGRLSSTHGSSLELEELDGLTPMPHPALVNRDLVERLTLLAPGRPVACLEDHLITEVLGMEVRRVKL